MGQSMNVRMEKSGIGARNPNGRPGKYTITAYRLVLETTLNLDEQRINKVEEFEGGKHIGHLEWCQDDNGIVFFGHHRIDPARRPGHGGLWSGNTADFFALTGIQTVACVIDDREKGYGTAACIVKDRAEQLLPAGYMFVPGCLENTFDIVLSADVAS